MTVPYFKILRAKAQEKKRRMKQELLEVLEKDILTEDNTDYLIDAIISFAPLPFYLKWLPLRAVLDRLLPGVLLKAIKKLVEKQNSEG